MIRVALIERYEKDSEAEAERHDHPDDDVASACSHAERPDEHRGHGAPEEQAEDRREMQEKETGGAGEAELGQRVHRERHIPRNDETADDPGDDRDDEAGRDRVLHKFVAEKTDQLVHQCPSPWSTTTAGG